MSSASRAALREWLIEPPSAEIRRSLERLRRLPDARIVAVMPDLHLSHEVCVGTVLATATRIYPQAVGSDPGCGVAAIPLGVEAGLLSKPTAAQAILAHLADAVPIRRHRAGSAPRVPPSLAQRSLSSPCLDRRCRREGREQFGTLGCGNHFLELQADEQDELWLTVHTGSRGMGVSIRDHHAGQDRASPDRGKAPRGAGTLVGLRATEAQGQACLRDLEWATDYSQANRQAIVSAAIEVLSQHAHLSPDDARRLDTCHNFVRQEVHDDEALWVHRKGAQSALQGEAGIIPGSMGTRTMLVEGRGNSSALASCSHGAGRVLSRTEARRRVSPRSLDQQMQGVVYNERLRARLVEEAPQAYRKIEKVLRAQRDLVRRVGWLRPLLVYKGG